MDDPLESQSVESIDEKEETIQSAVCVQFDDRECVLHVEMTKTRAYKQLDDDEQCVCPFRLHKEVTRSNWAVHLYSGLCA